MHVWNGNMLPGESGHCRARTRPVWWPSPPAGVFLQNILQLHQQRWAILRVYSFAFWKIINEEDVVLIPKNRGENFSSGFLHSEFFGVGSAAMPTLHWLLLCLRVIVTARFRPWSRIVTGNNLVRTEKNPKFAQTRGTVDVFKSRLGISGPTSRRASSGPKLHEWWTQPTHVRCPIPQLLI